MSSTAPWEPAIVLGRLGILAAVLIACAQAPPEMPAPPLPADMAGFDAEIIEQTHHQVRELERDRDNAAAWRKLGMLYHAHDQIDLASECYRQSLALAPERAAALLEGWLVGRRGSGA